MKDNPGFGDHLFDMVSDPQETNDLADCPEYRPVLDMMRARLSSVVDVSQTNEDAFKHQRQKIADFGGREAILEGEEFGYTPAPIRNCSRRKKVRNRCLMQLYFKAFAQAQMVQ